MDEATARELLARAHERVERGLAELSPSGDDGEVADLGQHLADYGSNLFEKQRDAGLAEALREELNAIERAQQRLAEGNYGISVQSGEPIPDARLEAIPWAERTAQEQTRYERGA